MSNNTVSVSNKQLELLVSWFGYGDLKKADIIFLGNEEGLGGRPDQLENMLDAKCTLLGNDPQCWLENERSSGCWEISAREADKKVLAYLDNLEGTHTEWRPFTRSFALQFQARMLLALEDAGGEWFKTKGEAQEYYRRIIEYVGNELYTPHAKTKSFLMDLRVLPRANESYWPFKNIEEDKYWAAFSYDHERVKANELFRAYADPRAQILKKALEVTPAKVMIGIGDKAAKRKFFEMYFTMNGMPLSFTEERLSTCRIETSSFMINGRQVLVLLCPFFDSRGNGHLKLAGLQELTENFVRPFMAR